MENLKQIKIYSRAELLKMEPLQLHKYLIEIFSIEIPLDLDSIEAMNKATTLISKATSYYSFLESMRVEANIQKTIFKESAALVEEPDTKKAYQQEYQNMLKREQIFESMTKITDRKYQGVSRMITIKQQVTKEIEMYKRG